MKKASKVITMAAVLTLSASLAYAAPHDGGRDGKFAGKRGGAHLSQRLADKLNLTDAQREQIKNLQTGFREQNKAFFESSRVTRQAFRDAKKANDTVKLEQLKPQMEAQRVQFKQLREAHQTQILSILTPEQRAQYESLKAQRGERRGGKRGGISQN